MKKYIILSVLFTLFGLVSCYDDDAVKAFLKPGNFFL